MRYIMILYNNRISDEKIFLYDELIDAFDDADEYKKHGYEIEIYKIHVEETSEYIDTYEALHSLFECHDSYEEFVEELEDEHFPYFKKYKLFEYVKDHYETPFITFERIPNTITVPVDIKVYQKIKMISDEKGISPTEYIYDIINSIFAEEE